MSNIPSAVLAQRGVPIKLIDGSEAVVVFTFSSLAIIEAKYGSVQAALSEAQGGSTAQTFTGMLDVFAAGLEHDPKFSDVAVLRYLLDPLETRNYSKAIDDAFDKSFPPAESKDDDAADPQTPGEASRGPSGNTSAASPSDDETTSSGA